MERAIALPERARRTRGDVVRGGAGQRAVTPTAVDLGAVEEDRLTAPARMPNAHLPVTRRVEGPHPLAPRNGRCLVRTGRRSRRLIGAGRQPAEHARHDRHVHVGRPQYRTQRGRPCAAHRRWHFIEVARYPHLPPVRAPGHAVPRMRSTCTYRVSAQPQQARRRGCARVRPTFWSQARGAGGWDSAWPRVLGYCHTHALRAASRSAVVL